MNSFRGYKPTLALWAGLTQSIEYWTSDLGEYIEPGSSPTGANIDRQAGSPSVAKDVKPLVPCQNDTLKSPHSLHWG